LGNLAKRVYNVVLRNSGASTSTRKKLTLNFDSFHFNPRILAGVQALGYVEPTPIQAQAMPPIMQGRDVMGLAQTGTGKTAAFVLPILERLLDGPRGRVRALIVAPTRELAEQTHDFFTALGRQTRLRSLTVYGGVSMGPQIDRLRSGVEIVIACPGRLLDHVSQRTIDLSHVEILVLDEADRMFDMGFLPDIRRILKQLPTQRQTLLFSATMPDDIRGLANDVLDRPVTVQIGHLTPVEAVSHALYPVQQHLKTELLLELLHETDTDSVLIFTRTKHRAEKVAKQLRAAGHETASLQGNLSQRRRQAALDGFRDGSYRILVATDIAARGIDVSSISHVINYDIPDTADAYTHRIGRTGRAAKTGDAFTLITHEDETMVRDIEKVLGAKLERRKIEGFNYQAPAPARDYAPLKRDSVGPAQRDTSRRTDRSPARHDSTPSRREEAPVKRDIAPLKRESVPLHRDIAPLKRDIAAVQRDHAPRSRDNALLQPSKTPRMRTASSPERSESLLELLPSSRRPQQSSRAARPPRTGRREA
jgi:ATP-dependent RNA helicase RhlE